MTRPEGPDAPEWGDAGAPSVGGVAARPAQGATAEVQPPAIAPTLKQALLQRVRFAGGELPLWAVVTPAVVAVAIIVALGSAAATAREVMVASPAPAASLAAAEPSATVSAAPVEPAPPAPVASPSAAPPAALGLTERAAKGEARALDQLSERPAEELSIEEALALSEGRAEQELAAARALRAKLEQDPALIKNTKTLSELYRFSQRPATAREALAAIAKVPGPVSADLLYEVWTGTPTKTETTELARALLLGKGVRAKASPALAVALELRTTEDCDALLAALPRVTEHGDKRSSPLLSKLQRKSGCGPSKRQDCYPCLRKGNELKDALKVVQKRREPAPFKG